MRTRRNLGEMSSDSWEIDMRLYGNDDFLDPEDQKDYWDEEEDDDLEYEPEDNDDDDYEEIDWDV